MVAPSMMNSNATSPFAMNAAAGTATAMTTEIKR